MSDLRTSDFDYQLPPERIAQYALKDRAASRMLVVRRPGGPAVRRSDLEDSTFTEFPALLSKGDLLVLNTTRVRHARFLGTRPSGAPAEVLLIHPEPGGTWLAMGKPGSGLQPGKRIALGEDVFVETVTVHPDGNRSVRFAGASDQDAIERFGRLPLPPYINREPGPEDDDLYQTVYAEREGSVAAPTAGLHFTPETLTRLEANGVRIGRLDLEVGPGTFKPVEVEDPARHQMHPERFEIPDALATAVRETRVGGGTIWATGTTVVRALESAAEADGTLGPGQAETSLMITPGFHFRVVDRLLTNFHLPRSTLLMLVSAFAGHELTMQAYQHAVGQRYRFYSYGDAMVIL